MKLENTELKNPIILLLILLFFFTYVKAQDCKPDSTKRLRITAANIPNDFSCYMEMTRGWHKYYGSGALIHPRVIITAGHNLAYFPFVKRIPFFLFRGTRKIDLYFGSIDSNNYKAKRTLKLVKGKNKFFKSGYWINAKTNRDFSIIILPDSSLFKEVGGCYKFIPVKPEELHTTALNLTGSPGDKKLFEMWTQSTNNFSITDFSLKYDLFTAVRNSGSPVWIQKNGIRLVGVHSRGYKEAESCNEAVMINEDTYKQVALWCKSAGVEL
ncbi:MAG: hypothetical protein J7577_08140 [Sphingobacteriaceae bacterium]|nr:hypothetical protein [Sphingobacteriaceae bacterium]